MECSLYHPLNAFWLQAQGLARSEQLVAEFCEALIHPLPFAQDCGRLPPSGPGPIVERAAAPEHGLLDLQGNHWTGTAEILANLLNLPHNAGEEVQISFYRAAAL